MHKTRQVYPQDTNHHHTMFGGTLMANIDEIAITAMKHAGNPVVTASTDSVDFLRPITTGDILSYKQWFLMQEQVRWRYVFCY